MTRTSIHDGENITGKFAWKQQPNVLQETAPPTLNNWYTLLDAHGGIMLDNITFAQTNDETELKRIEVEVTIDDMTPLAVLEISAEANVYNCVQRTYETEGECLGTYKAGHFGFDLFEIIEKAGETVNEYQGKPTYMHAILIRYRITDANGTNQHLYAQCHYSKLEAV